MMHREFERVREALCRAGIPASSLSISNGSSMTITSRCGFDEIPTSLHYRDGRAAEATPDIELHRAMYARSRHRAVLVCQPPYAMTLASMGKLATVDGLEQHPRKFAASEILIVKGRAVVTGGVDPEACLAAVIAFETSSRGQLPGASRV